ncbi:MAG: MgtC/SapB family protein [Candidatus Vogelbacteria bacterium]|nr:MgtC/SapB family protein [Candidatus Vogelbacteria bacterium]
MEIAAISGNLDVFIRLLVAVALGALIGIERSMAHKTAGMRTFSLISMGTAALIILSEVVIRKYLGSSGADPLRMAAAVVQGIGFLGAGIYVFSNHHMTGITTAAGLWVAAAIGIACGFGLYGIALILTFITLFVFSVLWLLEEKVVEIADENKLYAINESEHIHSKKIK